MLLFLFAAFAQGAPAPSQQALREASLATQGVLVPTGMPRLEGHQLSTAVVRAAQPKATPQRIAHPSTRVRPVLKPRVRPFPGGRQISNGMVRSPGE